MEEMTVIHASATLTLCVLLLALSAPAEAYLDPVTGSLFIQGLVALVAGVVAGVKTIRLRIIGFFASLFGRKDR